MTKLQAAQESLKESIHMHSDIRGVIESQTAELGRLRNTVKTQADTIKSQADTIKDLSAQLSTRSRRQGPPKTPSGKFVIGDKVYVQDLAGSMNEGVYIEKEGRIKNGYQEKTILSEYTKYKVGGTIDLEPVMLKNTEFYRTFNGDLLQKQEELVEIDGKSYVRRRLHVAYDSDQD